MKIPHCPKTAGQRELRYRGKVKLCSTLSQYFSSARVLEPPVTILSIDFAFKYVDHFKLKL